MHAHTHPKHTHALKHLHMHARAYTILLVQTHTTHKYTHSYMHAQHIYIIISAHTCTHAHTHIHTHACTHVCTHTHMHTHNKRTHTPAFAGNRLAGWGPESRWVPRVQQPGVDADPVLPWRLWGAFSHWFSYPQPCTQTQHIHGQGRSGNTDTGSRQVHRLSVPLFCCRPAE